MKSLISSLFALCAATLALFAQDVLIHSHNDYRQTVPFYEAYSQRVASIEADIWLQRNPDRLLVAHDKVELSTAPTLDEAYIQPIVRLFKKNGGKAWAGSERCLQLLIDIKSDGVAVMKLFTEKLKAWPEVFDPAVNPLAVRVVMTGGYPQPFGDYPSFFAFDGYKTDHTKSELSRMPLISLNLRDYTQWNGKGSLTETDHHRVQAAIDRVHAQGKLIRFWGTPDGVTAWNTFYRMGVDYINTDHPEACAAYFHDFHKKNFQIGSVDAATDVAQAKRLDKTTSGFQGFRSEDMRLSQPVTVYQPTFASDGAQRPVRNVILLIGDGMGLAQVCAADAVNRGLTMLNMRHIGLSDTQAEDDYTTDSAAGGSAIACGRKNKNRHICMGDDGTRYPSLTDLFFAKGAACGVVTLGNIADATPAAFYGHSTERDSSNLITASLLDGKLTLLCGSGMSELTQRNDGIDLINDLKKKLNYSIQSSVADINTVGGKLICIDERMGKAATEATLPLLADATRGAIQKLTAEGGGRGFFLMVEGAKIDYAGHAGSLPGSVIETLSFDLAVAEALRFADIDGETLVIVTADHETGGLSLVDGDYARRLVTAQYMTDDHTPIRVPVFAYGPHASDFIGAYPNTEIFHRIKKAADIK